jgi:hypothetical protein
MPPGRHRNLEFQQDGAITGSYQVRTLDEWPDAGQYLHEYTPVFVLDKIDRGSDALHNYILSLAQGNSFLKAMYDKVLDDFAYLERLRYADPEKGGAYASYDPRRMPEQLLAKRVAATKDDRGNISVAAYMSQRNIISMMMPLGTQYTNISSVYPSNPNISVITQGEAHVADVFQPPANRYNYLWYVLKRELLDNGKYGAQQWHPISTVLPFVPRRQRVYVDMNGNEQTGFAYFFGRVTDREYARPEPSTVKMACGFAGSLAQQNMALLALKPLRTQMYQSRLRAIQAFA